MKKRPDRVETEAKINARAWKDPDFKRQLISDPRTALKELGMDHLPQSLKIRVIEEDKNHWTVVLRVPPENYDELSAEDLVKVSAAGKCSYIL